VQRVALNSQLSQLLSHYRHTLSYTPAYHYAGHSLKHHFFQKQGLSDFRLQLKQVYGSAPHFSHGATHSKYLQTLFNLKYTHIIIVVCGPF
jgi:hypothetical protein